MVSYIITFSAGVLCGTIVMGLYVAFVSLKDAWDNW